MKKYYRDEEINKGRNVLLSIFSALIICVIVMPITISDYTKQIKKDRLC